MNDKFFFNVLKVKSSTILLMMKIFFSFLFLTAVVISFFSCSTKNTLFEKISSSKSGVHFNNEIKETDSVNILDVSNVYNGGGVGIGDFNKDGLEDIYFTGNVVSNKLYLNKGNFKFEDITDIAKVGGEGRWCRGVSVVDINNDGWLDMYVCTNILTDPHKRENLLYINEGNDKNGIPHFKEMAAEYGLNDTTYSTQAAFFDYDNDGDLDMYLSVNEILAAQYPNQFRPLFKDGSFPSTGRLYRNDWNDSLKHPVFTDVSKQAGVTTEGYAHSVIITDINKDGWKDIYVTNDYLPPNLLYINNHDGTFTNEASTYFKHTSANAMGQDIEDINNDGLADIIELDMNPQDNYRKKLMLNPNSYSTYQNSDYFAYQYQYVRNTLQLNQGPRVNENDSIGPPIFSEISFLGGIAETDWSWTPLVTDFDNDGYRDIIVTNGFPKDVTDHDFVAFRNESYGVASKDQLLSQIPTVKIKNYAFHNNGNLTFSDVSDQWGIQDRSFSNGAAYADLDNDGDLDYVVNNINDEAFVYENHESDNKTHNNYLQIKFSGQAPNINGLGAWVEIYYDHGQKQVYENTPYRGYLSSVEMGAHFGLGDVKMIDSILVKWPNLKMEKLVNIKVNQKIIVQQKNATQAYSWQTPSVATNALFKDVTNFLAPNVQNKEYDFIDFNVQKLLPHKLSEYGPGLAIGDVNNDGLEDLVMGGSYGYSPQILLQQQNGKFTEHDLIPTADKLNKTWEEMGMLLFDADGDGDNDLYISCGSYESDPNTDHYQDKLYVNDGKGNFSLASGALPINYTSKSCVRAIDFDNDGDLDLFVAGRCVPSKYPEPTSCFIYRNDSKNGKVIFTDVTQVVAPELKNIGMTCDALWTDFDNDGWTDLILAGEFMPIKFFKNNHGKLTLINTGIDNQVGWWNSIVAGDFDNDGDIDFILGNVGENSFYRPSEKYPVKIYAKDFDNNGVYDALPSVYIPASADDTTIKEFPAQVRDDLIKQMIEMRRKFPTYKSFATATFDKLLTPDELKGALVLSANNFKTSYIRNDGNGKFTMISMPVEAQFSSVFGMVTEDVNNDGNLDVIMNGNDYGTEVSIGRYDAFNGLVLLGDGKGSFNPQSILQSGIFIPGNGKALAKFCNKNDQCFIAASQNRGPLKVFLIKQPQKIIPVQPNETYALLHLKNGKTRKEELYWGESFLSQSGRFINMNNEIASIDIFDSKGNKRTVR